MDTRHQTLTIPSKITVQVSDKAGFYDAITKHDLNAFILDCDLPAFRRRLTFFRHSKGELLERDPDDNSLFFFITNEENVILAAASLRHHNHSTKDPEFYAISVDSKVRRKGLGTALIRSVFEYAQENFNTLRVSGFEHMGKRYFPTMLPKLHRGYPELILDYPCGEQVKGSDNYILEPEMTYFRPRVLTPQ